MKQKKLLLDVGCGEGLTCIKFAKENWEVIGVEKNSKIFELAKINVKGSKEKKNISLIKGDVRKIKLNKKFDGVLFNYVLMFMPKKDALSLVEKFYQKLNRGGELLVRILMFDDPMASEAKNKKEIFYPSYEEMKEFKKNYKSKLEFKLLRDDAHGNCGHPHIHSVGFLKIIKRSEDKPIKATRN